MAVIKHTALNLISDAKPITSFKTGAKKSGWNTHYLEHIIRQTA